MYREDKSKQDKGCPIIKITTFVNHKPKEQIIKSSNIIEELNRKKGEEAKHEGSDKEVSDEEGEAELEEINIDHEQRGVEPGDIVFLINQHKYALVKSCIEDILFECDVKVPGSKIEDIQMLML
jgi:hypothetical protein